MGPITEYLGCRIDRVQHNNNNTADTVHLTQPVLIQSISDQFTPGPRPLPTPASQGTLLSNAAEGEVVDATLLRMYRAIIGKLMHIARWSRPEIYNAVREGSRHVQASTPAHRRYVDKICTYLVHTAKRGCQLKPTRTWCGKDK